MSGISLTDCLAACWDLPWSTYGTCCHCRIEELDSTVCFCLPVYLSVCLHMVGLIISPWARSDSNLLSCITVNAVAPDDSSMLTLIMNMSFSPLSLIQHTLTNVTELGASCLNKYHEYSFNNSAHNEL